MQTIQIPSMCNGSGRLPLRRLSLILLAAVCAWHRPGPGLVIGAGGNAQGERDGPGIVKRKPIDGGGLGHERSQLPGLQPLKGAVNNDLVKFHEETCKLMKVLEASYDAKVREHNRTLTKLEHMQRLQQVQQVKLEAQVTDQGKAQRLQAEMLAKHSQELESIMQLQERQLNDLTSFLKEVQHFQVLAQARQDEILQAIIQKQQLQQETYDAWIGSQREVENARDHQQAQQQENVGGTLRQQALQQEHLGNLVKEALKAQDARSEALETFMKASLKRLSTEHMTLMQNMFMLYQQGARTTRELQHHVQKLQDQNDREMQRRKLEELQTKKGYFSRLFARKDTNKGPDLHQSGKPILFACRVCLVGFAIGVASLLQVRLWRHYMLWFGGDSRFLQF